MKDEEVIVSKQISDDEVCIRCIYSPYHIDSKGKIKREALLPPKFQNDISLLRNKYMSLEKCVEHGHKIGDENKKLFALASITRENVKKNNETFGGEINADIYYAPMNKGEYVDTQIDIYLNDSEVDLPAHADLKYDHSLDEDELVKTNLRKYASSLVKKMQKIDIPKIPEPRCTR